MSDDNLISVKELAAKLKVTDALVKKLIKDFGIETQRAQKRIHLDEASVTTIREILALRASGKKNKEIKELFDAAKQDNKVEKKDTKAEKKEEKAEKKETKAKKTTTKKTKAKEETKAEDKEKEEKKDPKAEKKDRATKGRKKTKAKDDSESSEKEEAKKDEEEGLDITSYLDETEDDEISMAMRLAEDDTDDEDESEAAELDEEDLNLDEDEDEEVTEEVEEKEQRLSPKKARRRQFSFRYIQRQIANDAKRIQYIKQKLKRGRLSTKERLYLEDSLEHRSKLHSGWVHLLRWVKS